MRKNNINISEDRSPNKRFHFRSVHIPMYLPYPLPSFIGLGHLNNSISRVIEAWAPVPTAKPEAAGNTDLLIMKCGTELLKTITQALCQQLWKPHQGAFLCLKWNNAKTQQQEVEGGQVGLDWRGIEMQNCMEWAQSKRHNITTQRSEGRVCLLPFMYQWSSTNTTKC